MDASYSSMTVVGRITDDPKTRTLPDGRLAANGAVAVNRFCRGQEGVPGKETDFFNMAFYGRSAEVFSRLCRKGDVVLVHGRMITRRGVSSTGEPRLYHNLVAYGFQKLPRRFHGEPGPSLEPPVLYPRSQSGASRGQVGPRPAAHRRRHEPVEFDVVAPAPARTPAASGEAGHGRRPYAPPASHSPPASYSPPAPASASAPAAPCAPVVPPAPRAPFEPSGPGTPPPRPADGGPVASPPFRRFTRRRIARPASG